MSWFQTGETAEKRLDQEIERQEIARKERGKTYVGRWWMPVTQGDTGSFVTFVDDLKHPGGFDTPFAYSEHQIFLNGHWRNWFTCIEGLPHPTTKKPQKCPLCETNHRPALVSVFTIIDEQEWTDKNDVKHKNELKLFVCKTAVAKQLRRAMKKKGGLRGWRCEISRTSGDAPNTGDTFDFDAKVELPAETQPFNYEELMAPKTAEEIDRIITGKGGYSATPVDADDDNIRF